MLSFEQFDNPCSYCLSQSKELCELQKGFNAQDLKHTAPTTYFVVASQWEYIKYETGQTKG